MVEFRVQPGVKSVARLTSCGELCAGVIRVGGLLVILQMAGSALRRKSLELAHSRALVAFVALYRSVCTEKWEAILVILHLLNRCVPSADGVALGTVRTKFAPVNVRMAVSAGFAHIRENRLNMTLRAANLLVHASERIVGLVVVEFKIAADRTPAACRVAIFAGNYERSVWTAGAFATSLPK